MKLLHHAVASENRIEVEEIVGGQMQDGFVGRPGILEHAGG
jgi:hypothetical protein